MHGITHRLLLVASLISMTTTALAIGKTTVDPSSVKKVEAPGPVGLDDKRLDQRITYETGNARLHDVVAYLAKASDVTIYCGKSPEDWRVRDIPVTLAVRDITLRKLLDYLLYSTHTALVTRKTEKGVICYRVVRDTKVQKALDDYEKAVKDYDTACAKWSLSAGARLAAVPGPRITPPQNYEKAIKDDRAACPAWSLDETARLTARLSSSASSASDEWWNDFACKTALSRMLAALDSKAKVGIMSGEPLWLTPRTAPAGLRDALLGFLKAADANALFKFDKFTHSLISSFTPGAPLPAASPAELEDSRVRIILKGSDIVVDAGVFTSGDSSSGNHKPVRRQTTSASEVIHAAASYCKGSVDMSDRPQEPRAAQIDPSSPDLTLPDWESPDLPAKVNVKLADDKKPKRNADALIAISKAAGWTVICEDFQSHRKNPDLSDKFTSECTLADALEKALAHTTWRVDTKAKVLVGYHSKWAAQHRNLIPERIVDSLTAKVNGNGADIDDLTPLCAFTLEAVSEWMGDVLVFGCKEEDRPVWAFCDSLSARNKTLAKGTSGLALGGLDLTLLQEWIKESTRMDISSFSDHQEQPRTDWNQLNDPRVLRTLVIRLMPSGAGWNAPAPVRERVLRETATKPPAAGSDLVDITDRLFNGYYCSLTVDRLEHDQTVCASTQWPGRLPYFSVARAKELDELRRKRDAIKKPE